MSLVDVCLIRSSGPAGEPVLRLGVGVLDDYLEFVAGRCRANTTLAVAYDLQVFFKVVGKAPDEVRPRDVLAFMTAQRTGQPSISKPAAGGREHRFGEPGAATTVVVGLGFVRVPPRPRRCGGEPGPSGTPDRRERHRPRQGVPLVRGIRTVPRILAPAEVDALTAALRTHRGRAMVAAMVLGGLRRCEVLGLRPGDLGAAERRVFIAEGKGGHQRLVPVSGRFFDHVRDYLEHERPPDAESDRLFVVLKRPRRGRPLTAAGLDEILAGARSRAGLEHATCHELRHTCLTRLR